MVSPDPLLEKLPWDIRSITYGYVFSGSVITIEQDSPPTTLTRVFPPIPPDETLTPTTKIYRSETLQQSMNLLYTSKSNYTTLLPILASHTTLDLPASVHDPDKTILLIPPTWLAHIPHIECNARVRSRITHVLRQTHVSPSLLPSLKTYRIAHLVYPDWRPSNPSHEPHSIEPFVQSYLESEFFFQAGTLKLFTRERTYQLTTTLWLLRAFVDESVGWEVEFSLDTWTVISQRRAKFHRQKDGPLSSWDDPKCRDYRNYHIEML